jgi:hypothetical protein
MVTDHQSEKAESHCFHRLLDLHSAEYNFNQGTEFRETQAYEIISIIDYTIN